MLADAPVVVVAIDPGLSGAIWKLGRGVNEGVRDFKSLSNLVHGIQLLCSTAPLPSLAVIEDVHAMPGQGVCSMFSFGRALGAAEASLLLTLPAGCPAQAVSPQKWQNFYRRLLLMPREADFESRAVACRLMPEKSDWFSRKKDHNSADAALMAAWGLAQTCGEASISACLR